jgi:hypothetical protein
LIGAEANHELECFGSTRMPPMRAQRVFHAPGLLRMEAPEKYRQFAEECERLAKRSKNDAHRRVLQEMAEVWRNLAEGAEKKA